MTTGGSYEAFADALLDDDPETLYEQAPCGYVSTTPDGLIVKANRTFLTLTGYRHEELVGARTFAQLLTAGGRIYHETHYAPMLRMQGTAREIALEIVRRRWESAAGTGQCRPGPCIPMGRRGLSGPPSSMPPNAGTMSGNCCRRRRKPSSPKPKPLAWPTPCNKR